MKHRITAAMSTKGYLCMHHNQRTIHYLVSDLEKLRSDFRNAAKKLENLELVLRMRSHMPSVNECITEFVTLVDKPLSINGSVAQQIGSSLNNEAQPTAQAHDYRFDQISSDSEEYKRLILYGITDCIIRVESIQSQDSKEILIKYIYELSQAFQQETAVMPLLGQDCDRMNNKIEELRIECSKYRALLEQCNTDYNAAVQAKLRRDFYHVRLQATQASILPHEETKNRHVLINNIKHWIPISAILWPALNDLEKVALQRAEHLLMEEEEERCKSLLKLNKLNNEIVRLQALFRGFATRKYRQRLLVRYNEAVTRLQRFWKKAVRNGDTLPIWCVLGREVLVDANLARNLAITFTFFPKKDFPTGNWKRVEGKTLDEMMDLCRRDEYSAGFATNGTFKRFIPRKLTQLKIMDDSYALACKPGETAGLCGLYVKTWPTRKTEFIRVIQSGIIVSVPSNRHGLVTIIIDGVGTEGHVPISALKDRWKYVWIRERKDTEKARKFGRRVAVGQIFSHRGIRDYPPEDLLIDRKDVDIVRPANLLKSALRDDQHPYQAAIMSDEHSTLSLVYEDQLTHLLMREVPSRRTHYHAKEREQVIKARMKAYQKAWGAFCAQQELNSVIMIQCAWRRNQARMEVRRVLQLRMQEKQHEDTIEHRLEKPKKHPIVLTGFFRSKRRGRVPKSRSS